MRVFVTGATGFVGTAIVVDLIEAGHNVTGLARSDEGAAVLTAAGAAVQRGTIDDLDILRAAADASDGVIHTAFNHDFSRFADNAAQDRRAIETLGSALEGSDRPLLVTSGLARIADGRTAVETDAPPQPSVSFPRASEVAAAAVRDRGVHASAIRLPPSTHGKGDHGFVPILIDIARQTGEAAFIGEGLNRWPAGHRFDAARVFRLALEKGAQHPTYHAVVEEGVAFRDIAAMIGRKLGLPVVSKTPEEATGHFGWFAMFAGADVPASSDWTRETLGWNPTQIGLLDDMERHYFVS